jgi:translocation and assembly module TamB
VKRLILVSSLTILASALGALCWLLLSESGLHWAYGRAQPHVPGKLEFSRLSGRLTGPVTLEQLQYRRDATSIAAERITFDWNPWALIAAEFDVNSLHIENLELLLAESPATDEGTEPGLDLAELTLPIGINLQQLVIDGIEVTRRSSTTTLDRVESRASLEREKIRIENFEIASDLVNLKLSGAADTVTNLPHDFVFSWDSRLASGETILGKGRVSGDLSRTRVSQQIEGAAELELALTLDAILQQLNWRAQIDITALDTRKLDPELTPLTGAMTLAAEGDLTSLAARGSVRLDQSPYGPISSDFELAEARLNQQATGLSVTELKLSALQGEIITSGMFDWKPSLAWQARISAAAINPQDVLPQWPGNLDADFDIEGGIDDTGPALSLDVKQLSGELRGYPVSLAGKMQWRNNLADISNLLFTSGDTRFSATGTLGQQLDLGWTLDSGNLAELYPEASGKLLARGSLGGSRESPSLEASLSGSSIGIPDYEIGKLSADARVMLQLQPPFELEPRQFEIKLDASQVKLRGYQLQTLKLTTDTRHIELDMSSAEGQARIELAGSLEGARWQGQIVQARLQNPDVGDWRLAAPADLLVSQQQVEIESLCLANAQGSKICTLLQHRQSDGAFNLDLSSLPLEILRKWTPAGLSPEGLANASARLKYQLPDRLHGTLDIDLPAGSVGYRLPQDRSGRLDYQRAGLKMSLRESGVNAKINLVLTNGDGLEGDLVLPGANLLAPDLARQSVTGRFNLKLTDLSLIDSALQQIENLRGTAEADIEVAGTLENPAMKGNARLVNADLFIPDANLGITQLNVEAESADFEQINYSADALIAAGKVSLTGTTIMDSKAGWPSLVNLSGNELELANLLNNKLPEGLSIDGRLNAGANLSYREPRQLTGKIEIRSVSGTLAHSLLEGEIEQWNYRDVHLDLEIDGDGARADSSMMIDNNSLRAFMDLPGVNLSNLGSKSQRLRGNVEISLQDFSLLEVLIPAVQKPSGKLQLSLDVNGSVERPELTVRAQMRQASLQIPRLGLALEQISLQADSDQTGLLSFSASARSGDGEIRLQGSSQLDAALGWPTAVSIEGDNFEVARIPEATVSLTPRLEVRLKDRNVDIEGEITVPYAKLQPRDVTSAAKVSNDAVIIGGDQPADSKWLINSKTRVLLGERVTFFGYGFEASLGGNLIIEENPGMPTRGTGEITIIEGRYRAYGQNLDIENGRLLFTGGPVDNPGLDIRAVRKTRDVTAGIAVTGRLQQPRLDLFSIPALGQTETLSYLLTGRPLESATSGEGDMMANAALALGLSGGDRIARSLSDRFGLDEMRVDTSGGGDQASLVVGRYLSPRLYVGYGVGLIESINTLNLNYRITDHWELEAESGKNQGADLFYRFER